MATLDTILTFLRGLAPEETAMSGDPVGLLIGHERLDKVAAEMAAVGVCLDATPDVVEQAIGKNIQLLIAHHPLIYHPLRRIVPATDPISRAVVGLIKHDIVLYAMHTNWDKAFGGINDTLGAVLGLTDVSAFGPENLPRIGNLPAPVALGDFFMHVQHTLSCEGASRLRISKVDLSAKVQRIAVCGGAGGSMLSDAIAAGAEAYVTSDVRHHEFLEAAGRGVALLDAGHGATETPGMQALAKLLSESLPDVSTVWLAG